MCCHLLRIHCITKSRASRLSARGFAILGWSFRGALSSWKEAFDLQCRGHLLTIIKGCMPLSNASKSPLQQQAAKDQNTNHKKRKSSGNSPTSLQPAKKLKEDSTITMTESQKRANFSALTNPSNGLNRHASPLLNIHI